MTQDEIRKLLGGYATDALTADERRILFEAALEDQELFNTLQNEDALRELLADPVAREQVRMALKTPARSTRRTGFWSRRWMFGVAVPAMLAVIVIAVMYRPNTPQEIALEPAVRVQAPVDATANPAPPKPAPTSAAKKQTAASSAPARAIPAPAQFESAPRAAAPAVARFRANSLPVPDDVRQRFASGFAADAPLYQGPLVQYSLFRSGPDGGAVRVEVSTRMAGYLALYEVNAAGDSTRVYPANDVAVSVLPDVTIQIPGNAIKIADAGTKLRLVVIPTASSAVVGQLGGAIGGATLGTGNAPNQLPSSPPVPPAPLIVDIPLSP